MGNKHKYIFTGILTIAVVCSGIFLPQMISGFMDQRLIDQPSFESLEKNENGYQRPLTMFEKLSLIKSACTASATASVTQLEETEASSGQKEKMIDFARKGIANLSGLSLMKCLGNDVHFKEATASICQDKDNPSLSMKIWTVFLTSEEGNGVLTIDDQTGKILQLTFQGDNPIQMSEDPQKTASLWGSYLGLKLQSQKIISGQIDTTIDTLYQTGDNSIEYPVFIEKTRFSLGPSIKIQ